MPRPPNPLNGLQQQRQRAYRSLLAERHSPEASTVDLALAGAATAYIDALEAGLGSPAHRSAIKILLRGALDLLVAAGYARSEAVAVLRRRVTRGSRRDLEWIVQTSRVRQRMEKT